MNKQDKIVRLNKSKKVVFHFLNTGNYSGAENVVINIATLINDCEHVYVSPSGAIDKILKEFNIRHIVIKKLTSKTVYNVIKNNQPTIVHAHDFRASIMIARNASYIHSYGGFVISHLHNNDPRMRRFGLLPLLYRWSIPKYNKIIVVSESIIDEYIFSQYIKKNIDVLILKNIVNDSIILRKADMFVAPRSDLIYVGRLVEQKNPIMFLEIVKLITKVFPNVKANILGDGPLREKTEKFIWNNELTDNIELIGFTSNPYPYIKSSKIGVSTSKWEGFGLSILEEQLLGNPVVATPVGGVVDLVNEDVGMLSNSIKEMSAEIIQLLSNETYLAKKSCMAKENVKTKNSISHFQSILREVYGVENKYYSTHNNI
ncbi:glycosyl transferase family 1 [Leuconostoc gasicomitatum]|uniref:glycosyltransferase n=1 Tax=Leuconostoc TaxID=1243 RepID=UPI0001DB5B99|nr:MULTISPECIES: glycosyltransferase [Leuconostoc]MBZ5952761.1 glycosyltransferase [Leuconostoc gasicomitatum]MBZ6008540.1 glycosyltransferase [Leuconostoc gelidum subsp. aenigmaticum]CBL91353.1 Glycosyltransferase, putative [Leuconostoc gasicomitatum LMG 18811]CUW08532.1 Exopolysaccharide biosynthesis glycosyltransferase EpsF [Leuconostoc inhae]CUW12237.1 Exopolysaccharide biosynthesis glycosyltransferase EpsF [Leuconostoc inhae]